MRCSHLARSSLKVEHVVNWDGDRIVRPAVVQAFRPLPGLSKQTRSAVDVRAFVSSSANAVLTQVATDELARVVISGASTATALAPSAAGSFDLRAVVLEAFVARQIRYTRRHGKYFQLPEETLARKEGDCEDRAILLAALLVAAGISQYNVRVALGTVSHTAGGRTHQASHAWVAYKDEIGDWLLLDPPAGKRASKSSEQRTFSYDPAFLFNGDHLWFSGDDRSTVPSPSDVKERWNGLDPAFHGEVHRGLIDDAFASTPKLAPFALVHKLLRQKFAVVFGQVIDTPDITFRTYDPRDHFDNGLIDESFARVNQRLQTFYAGEPQHPQGLHALCYALHAIADFYAHTSYAHFAMAAGWDCVPYDAKSVKKLDFDYFDDELFVDMGAAYTPNRRWFDGSARDAFELWQGKIISGRYSQPHDGRSLVEDITRGITDVVNDADEQRYAGSLPHHDDMAVDEQGEHKNLLYPLKTYKQQFGYRYKTAVKHVAQAIAAHPKLGK
jgi:hypothetical protein